MTGGTCHQLGTVAPWRSVLLFSLRFQPKQQTALAALLAVSLLGFVMGGRSFLSVDIEKGQSICSAVLMVVLNFHGVIR